MNLDMAHDTKLTVHDNIWHFSVTDPQLHRKGYTVYKVTCKTFPIKSPETLTEVVCWKRYNDFKTLYKSLTALHKALHRRDVFPDFAKPKLFGRFDENVIEERRLSALELLNFVASQPHLYKSLVFKQFLEEGRIRSEAGKKGSLMSPRPSNLDILASGPQTEGNPPPDIVPVSLNTHRNLQQKVEVKTPTGENESEGRETTPKSEQASSNSGSNGNSSDVAMLEGTWNFPQVADNISLDSSTGDETVDTDEDSILASSLPDTDLAFFDPLPHDASAAEAEESGGGIARSNSWLLAGLNMCAEMDSEEHEEDENESDTATTPMGQDSSTDRKDTAMSMGSTLTNTSASSSSTLEGHQSDLSSPIGSASRTDSVGSSAASQLKSFDLEEFDPIRRMSQSSDTSKVECGKGDLDLSQEWHARSSSCASETSVTSHEVRNITAVAPQEKPSGGMPVRTVSGASSRSQSVGSDRSQDSEKAKSNKSTPSRTSRNLLKRLVTGSPGTQKPRSQTDTSVSTMDLGGKDDYIYLAASQISMAQNSEANGEYEVAFAYYKSGVGILLQGVQGDTNRSRRDAVRRKTAQYLMKAEDLFNKHLAAENVDERRWGADSFLSPSLDLDPSFAFIRGSVKELRNFQVLGTIDTVILVRDKSTDETFVLKSIPKSTTDTGRAQSILPTSCPYMVSLHKFYETDDAVFLLLQYASGGKLWTYIGDYLNSDKGYRADAGVEVDVLNTRTESGNIYSGTKVEKASKSDISTEPASTKSSDIMKSDTSESTTKGSVQSSENAGVMRYSSLKKDSSENYLADAVNMISSQNNDVCVEEVNTVQAFGEDLSFNDSDVKELPAYSTPKEVLSRRFSSLSDDCAQVNEGDSSVISPTTILEEDQFHAMLQEHRSNLEGFSINSFESEDTSKYGSSFREKIDSIPEDPECQDDLSKNLTSRQISADEVFTHTRKEAHRNTIDKPIRHASTDGNFSSPDAYRFSSTFNADDVIQSSRELLKHVEKVLSETNDRTGESDHSQSQDISQNSSSSPSVAKLSSGTSHDSTEEPSIYDLNRSLEEDISSDHTSNDNSEKNLDSPMSNPAGLIDGEGDGKDTFAQIKAEETELASQSSTDDRTAQPSVPDTSELGGGRERLNSKRQTPSSVFRQSSTPVKLTLSRMDSKDMTRSASFECDLKSPTRNRARTVSDLFERLDSTNVEQVRIPETSIKKWMAQLVTAVARLHSLGIVCRDLKPSNVLLGDGGQAYLTYFCNLGQGDHNLDWDAKENLYAAPEVGSITGYDQACDWWSIGALLYELVVGRSLIDCHPGGINSHTCLHVPTFVSSEARGLLEGLLCYNPSERLGSGMAGAEEVKAHPFFAGVDWHALEYS